MNVPTLTLISGQETLLVNEALDRLRQQARQEGYTERLSLTLEARSDWTELDAATQNLSLFSDGRVLTLYLPSGKPGRTGAQALVRLADRARQGALQGVCVVVVLPYMSRAAKNSKWAKTLWQAAHVNEIAPVRREQLPQWIAQRLKAQQQVVAQQETLHWLADRVEGHLLAAHQEILKLGHLYPGGELSHEQVVKAVSNVARYDIFDLKNALLAGQAKRAITIIQGLEAEGEAAPLVLWAISSDLLILSRLAVAQERGTLASELKQQRLFGAQERLMRQALQRVPARQWPAVLQHAYDIDCLIKGLRPTGRSSNPWVEMTRLGYRIARTY